MSNILDTMITKQTRNRIEILTSVTLKKYAKVNVDNNPRKVSMGRSIQCIVIMEKVNLYLTKSERPSCTEQMPRGLF